MINGEMSIRTIREISAARGKKRISRNDIIRLRDEAKRIMWKHYSFNKASYPDFIRNYREQIIVALMKGGEVESVFRTILKIDERKVA